RTMTTNIVMEMGYSSGLHREALIGTAVVLFIFVLIINISFSLLHKEE
ncbi:phosphate ABC transporter permease subunit PstC, partial [Streptococcus anginosus]|nr:phosphate ABC transporter permease subunit PstC [Streptococcus anginosus]